MKTISADDTNAIELTLEVINSGGLVVFPTDTVYGLAVDAQNEAAMRRLFAVKGRDAMKTVPVMVNSEDHLSMVASNWGQTEQKLAQAFWPGALTIVTGRNLSFPDLINGDTTIGLRQPRHEFVQCLLDATVTSANISGEPPAVNAEMVLGSLGDLVDLVIDGGVCESGLSSTVVKVNGETVEVMRVGDITPEWIDSVLNR
ncbi:MAG TPA: L-threonylcarbamoyladenylate synthase [Bellilinea sp.]|nr:L-threonylcarbamoyladenylate synthase [Bellilinea sp.]